MQKCCSLGMDPVILNSIEEQNCISNYTRSISDLMSSIYFITYKFSKLEREFELLDRWSARVQRSLGLVLRVRASTLHFEPLLGNGPA